jgi:site-specific DNA-methyltransferase (adenine-specific)
LKTTNIRKLLPTEEPKGAPRNRTVVLTDAEKELYARRLVRVDSPITAQAIMNRTIHQDIFSIFDNLPDTFVDLIIADPPYNLTKSFNTQNFTEMSLGAYELWLDGWISKLVHILKPTGTIYICGDWRSSSAIHRMAQKYFYIHNRITWEREKGRGAKTNWKNCSEDIWFCTMSNQYTFNIEAVKLKRKVLAPYSTDDGQPKDWEEDSEGRFRMTYPSNLWTDITVPFWSMPENTDHPTQKPEKLLAKLILASSNPGDVVFDPFLGSGTSSVVASKLNRHYVGVEIDLDYCCLAEKRLEMAKSEPSIQGYTGGCFWERNTLADQKKLTDDLQSVPMSQPTLF